MKKINGRPEELGMDDFFGKGNKDNQFYGTYPKGLKVSDKPEIIFPKSTYDPIVGASIKGLQDATNSNMLSNTTPVGTIKVNTIPLDAEFFIVDENGNEISFGRTTPAITITDVDVGTYNYIIRKEGYADYTGSIEVKEGQICCVNVNMPEGTKKEQCATQPITGVPTGFPQSQPGYIVIKERDYYGLMGVLAGLVIAGIVYLILRKKE